jgi:hypothetical protein
MLHFWLLSALPGINFIHSQFFVAYAQASPPFFASFTFASIVWCLFMYRQAGVVYILHPLECMKMYVMNERLEKAPLAAAACSHFRSPKSGSSFFLFFGVRFLAYHCRESESEPDNIGAFSHFLSLALVEVLRRALPKARA